MKISVIQFSTLDGVTQGPGSSDEDPSDGFDRGGWLVPYLDETFVKQSSAWLDQADGLLFGRRTYEAFARDWPQIDESTDPYVSRMQALPKYVVSSTLTEASWNPTTLLGGNATDAVRKLKSQSGREIQVHGSSRLAAALLNARLVDTVRIAVAPVVIGAGRRLFTQPSADLGLGLTDHAVTATGLLLLEYEANGPAPRAEYEGVGDLT